MIANFFIWCSGAKKQVLSECPIEKGKYVSMGMAVFFVSLLSVVSATFFITYAFSNKLPDKDSGELIFDFNIKYLLPGILWGMIILTLDRNIIISIRKTGILKKELEKAWPRLLLAFFIGIVVSTPLEMKFFEKEINQKVEENIYKEENEKSSGDLSALQTQIKSLSEQIFKIEKDRDDAFKKATDEKDGNGLTGIARYGQKSKEWEKKSEAYRMQADSLKPILLVLNNKLNQRIDKVSIETLRNDGTIAKYDGAEKRITALYQLGGFHFVITALFIIIEILPLMVKLMSPRGPYDEVLDRMEYEHFIEQKKIISDKNSEINRLLEEMNQLTKIKSTTRIEIQKSKVDAELKANESVLKDIAEKQASLAKLAIKKWYSEELNKLKNDDRYNYAKTKPIQPHSVPVTANNPRLEESFWRLRDSQDKIEYFFRNGSANEVLYFENEQISKGKWSFNDIKSGIIIEIFESKTEYIISELSNVDLKLTEVGTVETLEFNRV